MGPGDASVTCFNIGSGIGLAVKQCQATYRTNDYLFSIAPLTNLIEIWNKMWKLPFKECIWNCE